MSTYPSKHKPNTPVEAPSADERWRPLAPRYAVSPPAAQPSPSGKVPAARSLIAPPLRIAGYPTAAPYAPLKHPSPPAFPPKLLVQRPPRCSDGDRPYLTRRRRHRTEPNGEGRGSRGSRRGRRDEEQKRETGRERDRER